MADQDHSHVKFLGNLMQGIKRLTCPIAGDAVNKMVNWIQHRQPDLLVKHVIVEIIDVSGEAPRRSLVMIDAGHISPVSTSSMQTRNRMLLNIILSQTKMHVAGLHLIAKEINQQI